MKNPFLSLAFVALFFCASFRPAPCAPDINAIQQKYIAYGLIPLTEEPGVNEQNHRLWQEACQSIIDMDRDVSTDPLRAKAKDIDIYMAQKLQHYDCNYLVKQFNIGEFGNRYYSIFSGVFKNGSTLWKSGGWFLYNPTNPKDIGPSRKYFAEMSFSVKGSTVEGEYRLQNGMTYKFRGMLSDTKLAYTLTPLSGGRIRTGKLEIRTPNYLFGTWADEPGSPKDHRGEWDLTKVTE